MDTMMYRKPEGMEHFTINCRIRPNWIRIIVMALASTLASWLAFGLFCTVFEGSLTFWQALVTPLALLFIGLNLVTNLITSIKRCSSI